MLNKISRAILTIAGCAVGYGVFLLAKLLLKVTNGYEFTAKSEIAGAVFCALIFDTTRSEERRVGKECRSRWSPYH